MFYLALRSWWASGRDQTLLSPAGCHLIAGSKSEVESKDGRRVRKAERQGGGQGGGGGVGEGSVSPFNFYAAKNATPHFI